MSQAPRPGGLEAPHRPPTYHRRHPQQYARAGSRQTRNRQTQKRRLDDTGTSVHYKPDDLVTVFDVGLHQFSDQVALVDSSIHNVKSACDRRDLGKISMGNSNSEQLERLQDRAPCQSAVDSVPSCIFARAQSQEATNCGLVSVYASPNKSDVAGFKHLLIPDEQKVVSEKAIDAVARELITPVGPRQPPTEPKADRERKQMQRAAACRGSTLETQSSLTRGLHMQQGTTIGSDRRRYVHGQTNLPNADQRDMGPRGCQQFSRPHVNLQLNQRSHPAEYAHVNEHSIQSTKNAYTVANQTGPKPCPQEQRLTNRAREEEFAREISTVAVVPEEGHTSATPNPTQIHRQERQAKEYAARAVAEAEKQAELLQSRVNFNVNLGQSHLTQLPQQMSTFPHANGLVAPMDSRACFIYPTLPYPSFPLGCPAYPQLVPQMPPPGPPGPMLRMFPATMQPIMPIFQPLVPLPPAPTGLSSQLLFTTSQYKMCSYVDVRAEERRRNPVRIMGAGRLEYEKELWAQHMSDLRDESMAEDADFALPDPRQGQRVSQMNNAHRRGPSCFMPPRYSLSPKPEVGNAVRHLRDPLPDPVPMSGSTSAMSTPTLSYRKLHGRHRINAMTLGDKLSKLTVKEGKRPEWTYRRTSASPKALKLIEQTNGRPKLMQATIVGGNASNPIALSRKSGKLNSGGNKGLKGKRDDTKLGDKSFLGNTIFGEAPGMISREPSPTSRAGGRRGRRLYECSPIRSPVRTPPNQILSAGTSPKFSPE